MVKSEKPKEQKQMLVMKKPGGIKLTDIPTTAQKQEMKKLTEEKMAQIEKMMTEYKDINTTMGYYPRKTRNGTQVIILPQASPMLVSDFYLCGFIDTMYLDILEAIAELPQGLQQAIKSFAKFAKGKHIYIRFNSIPITSATQKLVTIMQIGISSGQFPTRDENSPEINGDEWYYSVESVYRAIHRVNHSDKLKKVRVNYFREYTFLYSLTNQETTTQDREILKKYEELFATTMEPFKEFDEDMRKTICDDFQKIQGHNCPLCKKKTLLEVGAEDNISTTSSSSSR